MAGPATASSLRQSLAEHVAAETSLESAGAQFDVEQRRGLSNAQLVLGDLLARSGAVELAADHWRAAAQRMRSPLTGDNPRTLTLIARAQVRLGEFDAARSLAKRIQASTYRHPDLAALVDELDHGMGSMAAQLNRKKANP
jgi:hypothetical protein